MSTYILPNKHQSTCSCLWKLVNRKLVSRGLWRNTTLLTVITGHMMSSDSQLAAELIPIPNPLHVLIIKSVTGSGLCFTRRELVWSLCGWVITWPHHVIGSLRPDWQLVNSLNLLYFVLLLSLPSSVVTLVNPVWLEQCWNTPKTQPNILYDGPYNHDYMITSAAATSHAPSVNDTAKQGQLLDSTPVRAKGLVWNITKEIRV